MSLITQCSIVTGLTVNLVIGGNVANYNVFANAGSPRFRCKVNLTINGGVMAYSPSYAPAMDVGVGWAAGSIINIINNGYIVGLAGGGGAPAGTDLGTPGNPGSPGGPALYCGGQRVVITNNGVIGGGGGGGGSGAVYAGNSSGYGGVGAGYGGVDLLTGQTGGNGYINDRQQWPGGAGGGPGSNGQPGGNSYISEQLETGLSSGGGGGGGLGASGGTGGIISDASPGDGGPNGGSGAGPGLAVAYQGGYVTFAAVGNIFGGVIG